MAVVFKTKHIIMLSKLVGKMGIKLDLTEKDQVKLGAAIVMDILGNIHLAESEFYELIASIADSTPAKVAEQPIEDLYEELKEVVTKLINFIPKSAK